MASTSDGLPSDDVQNMLTDLETTIKRFNIYRSNLLQEQKEVSDIFERIYEILGLDDPLTKRLQDEVKAEMKPVDHLKREPIILVSGQVNSGKSSLINEILGTKLVPTEQLPCTSRIVRIKYSEENYFQTFDNRGRQTCKRSPLKNSRQKEKLKEEIRQRSSGCYDTLQHNTDADGTVEIGMKSAILKSGIQIVDTPGMSENEVLDTIVDECLDGVLQVLVYVIDANRSCKIVDDEFISYIKNKAPGMKILYACNKCDDSAVARELDEPSDGEEEGDEVDACTEKLTKGEAVFKKLQDRRKINDNETIRTCDTFFQLSCTNVRRARRDANHASDDLFVQEFHRLVMEMIRHFRECVDQHLVNTVSGMYALATRAFDFFVSDTFLKQKGWNKIDEKMKETMKIEKGTLDKISRYILEQKSNLYDSIRMLIEGRKQYIVEQSGKIELKVDPRSGKAKTWSDGQTEQFRVELKKYLLQVLTDELMTRGALRGLLDTIDNEVKTEINALLNECRALQGVGAIIPQLESCYNIVLTAPSCWSFTKQLLRNAISKRIFFVLEEYTFKFIHAPTSASLHEWKRKTIKKLVDGLAVKSFGDLLCEQLSSKVKEAHIRFQNIFHEIRKVRKSMILKQRDLVPLIPELSTRICKLHAIASMVMTWGRNLDISNTEINHGTRSLLYSCTYIGETAVAKRVRCNDSELQGKFATLINYSRLLQLTHENILEVLDVHCDPANIIFAIVPFIKDNLFSMLCGGMQQPLRERLTIAYQIVDACSFLEERGFRATDLRPNNILMHGSRPVLNLLKWKSLETPYPAPDELAPFHWAPEVISGRENRKNTQDTYSCCLLIWMLAIGKFIRPSFARSQQFERIRAYLLHDMKRVYQDIYGTYLKSAARKNALDTELSLHTMVEGLLETNICEGADDRMEIGQLKEELKESLGGNLEMLLASETSA